MNWYVLIKTIYGFLSIFGGILFISLIFSKFFANEFKILTGATSIIYLTLISIYTIVTAYVFINVIQ